MKLHQKIKELFDAHPKSTRELCLQHNMNYNSFNDMLNGRKQPGLKTIYFVVNVFPDVDLNDLLKPDKKENQS